MKWSVGRCVGTSFSKSYQIVIQPLSIRVRHSEIKVVKVKVQMWGGSWGWVLRSITGGYSHAHHWGYCCGTSPHNISWGRGQALTGWIAASVRRGGGQAFPFCGSRRCCWGRRGLILEITFDTGNLKITKKGCCFTDSIFLNFLKRLFLDWNWMQCRPFKNVSSVLFRRRKVGLHLLSYFF